MNRIKRAAMFTLKTFFAIVAINIVFTVIAVSAIAVLNVH